MIVRFARLVRRIVHQTWIPGRPTWTNRQPQFKQYDIGDFTYGRPVVHDWTAQSRLTIGRFCSIAGGVHIFLDGDHRIDWVSTYPFRLLFKELEHRGRTYIRSKGDVRIGHDVWLGHECVIMSGVTVGNGAVIGARAVITQDVPGYGVAVGNPGKVLKYRFDKPTREALEALQWWDWPLEKIRSEIPLIMNDRVDDLLRKYRT